MTKKNMIKIREGVKKGPFNSLLLIGNLKELLGFFKNHVFVGVFQYDFGPPKHVLHLVWSVLGISGKNITTQG